MRTTKSEIVKIIASIRVQCPDALQYRTETDFEILVEMWFDCFKDYPKEILWKATQNALKDSEYQKKNWLGAINKEIEKMQGAYEKDDATLWAELQGVLREVSRCVYMFGHTYVEEDGVSQGDKARRRVAEIFDGLDPALKDYCRDQRGLVELARYTDEQTSYERGRFMRVMPTVRERLKTRRETPENIKMLLQGITEKMTLQIDGGNAPKRHLN